MLAFLYWMIDVRLLIKEWTEFHILDPESGSEWHFMGFESNWPHLGQPDVF